MRTGQRCMEIYSSLVTIYFYRSRAFREPDLALDSSLTKPKPFLHRTKF